MILYATLQQMAFLFSLIVIGYLLMKFSLVPQNAEAVLSKLENYLFIPALVLSTFLTNFTMQRLSGAAGLLLFSIAVEAVVIPLALLCSRVLTKDRYTGNIYLYGLCFSNFGYMGNAIVKMLFPGIFLEYILFTLVLWTLIYLWGTPSLLMPAGEKGGVRNRLRALCNPMFLCMIAGSLLGLFQIRLPEFADSLVDALSGCMSPVAMLITGMTIAKIDIKAVLKIKSIYAVSILRLLLFPLLFLGICLLLGDKLPGHFAVCALVSLAMPLGLNTVIIPSAYGKDTAVASGMALVSHVLSLVSIPVIFALLSRIVMVPAG